MLMNEIIKKAPNILKLLLQIMHWLFKQRQNIYVLQREQTF